MGLRLNASKTPNYSGWNKIEVYLPSEFKKSGGNWSSFFTFVALLRVTSILKPPLSKMATGVLAITAAFQPVGKEKEGNKLCLSLRVPVGIYTDHSHLHSLG